MSNFVQFKPSESTCDAEIQIISEVFALENEMIEQRRWFHAHPELSFVEVETAKRIVEILKAIGISEIFENIGTTGVVALIRGELGAGPCVLLRADMDALPVQETADVEYRSVNAGVMHACGHDGHMTGLLAAAKVLFAERRLLRGTIKLIFQVGWFGCFFYQSIYLPMNL